MFTSLIQSLRDRAQMVRSLDSLLSRPDDHLLDDIGLTRQDLRIRRQELSGLLALRAAAPRGVRLIRA